MAKGKKVYVDTPDGRYFVVGGRLGRLPNPNLDTATRARLIIELITWRRAVRDLRGKPEELAQAKSRVKATKIAIGESGPVWWTDGAPDYNSKRIENTPYADWFAQLKSGPGSSAHG